MLLKELLLIRLLYYKDYSIDELSYILKESNDIVMEYINNINESGFYIDIKKKLKMIKSESPSIVLVDVIHNEMIEYLNTLIEKKTPTKIKYYNKKIIDITMIPTEIIKNKEIVLIGKYKNKEYRINIDRIINY